MGRILLRSASDGTFAAVVSGGTALHSDTFETGDYTNWSEGEVTDPNNQMAVNTVNPLYGSYSLEIKCTNNAQYYAENILSQSYSDELWLHFYIEFNDVEDAGAPSFGTITPFSFTNSSDTSYATVLFVMDDASPPKFSTIRVSRINSAEGYDYESASFVPAANTTYEIKVRWDKAGGLTQAWVGTPGNLSLVIDASGSFSSSWAINKEFIGGAEIQGLGTWTTMNFYIDNYEIAESDIW